MSDASNRATRRNPTVEMSGTATGTVAILIYQILTYQMLTAPCQSSYLLNKGVKSAESGGALRKVDGISLDREHLCAHPRRLSPLQQGK